MIFLLYFDNSSANMSLLLLKVKMRRMDKSISEIGRHFQTFSVADKRLVEMTCFAAGLPYL